MKPRITIVVGAGLGLVLACLSVPSWATERYSGCSSCHGDFRGPVSPKGSVFPGDNKHDMHRDSTHMGAQCNNCHTSGGFADPFIGSSEGTPNNPGIGCTGCHDAVGLRAYHAFHNVTSCAGCHPGDPPADPESTSPVYYGTADTNVDDPCNGSGLESYSLDDSLGLDNDGDGLVDGDDPDCAAADCPEDIDENGEVDFQDLLLLLAGWSPEPDSCVGCPEDIDGDGDVDFQDLLLLLAAWGPCI
jgi:hypothetical protein